MKTNNLKVQKLVECQFEFQDDMDYEFFSGSCNTFTEPNDLVLLCFDYNNPQACFT